jgi:putative modified peptide
MAKNFSRDFADKLLDKLSHDDDFRGHFQRDPHSALASLGHVTPEHERGVAGSDPVVCLSAMSASLASKEEIKAARDTLSAQLTHVPFEYAVAS